MITRNGMSPTLGNIDLASGYEGLSPTTKSQIEMEVRQLIEEGHARARKLLESKRSELDILAKALVEYEVLSLDEMKKVLRGEKLAKMRGLKGTGIKLPEIVLPPGITSGGGHGGPATGTATAGVGTGAKTETGEGEGVEV